MQCSICHNSIIDRVQMTCKSAHSFCFSCILEYVEKNMELKSCPNCRGGNKYIIISQKSSTEDPGPYLSTNNSHNSQNEENFFSLSYFKKSLSILQKVKKLEENSCLVPESVLLLYITNKDQIELVNEILEHRNYDVASMTSNDDEEFSKLIKLIKWNSGSGSIPSSESMGNFFLNEILPSIGPEISSSFTQNSGDSSSNNQNSFSRMFRNSVPVFEEFLYSSPLNRRS